MKKAFSLMEVIISVMVLSVVMVTLLQIKNDNIYILSKSAQKANDRDYISLAINFDKASSRNEKLFLDDLYSFKNDELRKELKEIRINIKDEEIDEVTYETPLINLDIITYVSNYSIKDESKKSIYSFSIGELK